LQESSAFVNEQETKKFRCGYNLAGHRPAIPALATGDARHPQKLVERVQRKKAPQTQNGAEAASTGLSESLERCMRGITVITCAQVTMHNLLSQKPLPETAYLNWLAASGQGYSFAGHLMVRPKYVPAGNGRPSREALCSWQWQGSEKINPCGSRPLKIEIPLPTSAVKRLCGVSVTRDRFGYRERTAGRLPRLGTAVKS